MNATTKQTGMNRRQVLAAAGLAAVAGSTFPLGWTSAATGKKQKMLYFTRSAGYEHDAIKVKNGQPSTSTKVLAALGAKHGFEVEATKDGRVFDSDLSKYDCIAFYTTGDLTQTNKAGTPPMSPAGKKKLLAAIHDGLGFVGFHSATDSFHSKGPRNENQEKPDPYIAMIGGEFIIHGAQQPATIKEVSPLFPGVKEFGQVQKLTEEWYCLKNFARDLHVILVQDCTGMKGGMYQRPPFPETWARLDGKGRVFYTSFGHRDDIWANPIVQDIMLGGISWAMGNVTTDVTPNITEVTPEAWVLGK